MTSLLCPTVTKCKIFYPNCINACINTFLSIVFVIFIVKKLSYTFIQINVFKMTTPVIPFQAGSPIMISGPTGSGKTFWTHRLLKNDMFTEKVASILYCYGVYQPFFDKMNISNLEFHEGLPSPEKVQTLNDGNFHLIVLDDLMEYIIKSVEAQNLFTKYCHHYNISAIFITQNIFAQGPYARSISINTHILVLFANKRDESQAIHLAKQLYPGAIKVFTEAYQDATSNLYGYLVIDCNPASPRDLKLRTKIFPGERTICYIKK